VREGEKNKKKSGAGGKLYRLIFILSNDQQFGILPPWQIAVF
jgi:hypothetical protein